MARRRLERSSSSVMTSRMARTISPGPVIPGRTPGPLGGWPARRAVAFPVFLHGIGERPGEHLLGRFRRALQSAWQFAGWRQAIPAGFRHGHLLRLAARSGAGFPGSRSSSVRRRGGRLCKVTRAGAGGCPSPPRTMMRRPATSQKLTPARSIWTRPVPSAALARAAVGTGRETWLRMFLIFGPASANSRRCCWAPRASTGSCGSWRR
jgi:hypothetical protein